MTGLSRRNVICGLLLVSLSLTAIAEVSAGQRRRGAKARANTLTEAQKNQGWKLLFDGKTLENWKPVKGDEIPGEAWKVEGGMIINPWKDQRAKNVGGSIVTEQQYGQFELRLQYKLDASKDGKLVNSGIKYFNYPGTELGLEYQIFTADAGNPKHSVGDLYALFAAGDKVVRPAGQWNSVRIVARGRKVEHWLNGKKILEVERASAEFRKAVAESKFKDIKDFGEAEKGHILLQDHGGGVAFRNIMIRQLDR